jgi:hypothetical protein
VRHVPHAGGVGASADAWRTPAKVPGAVTPLDESCVYPRTCISYTICVVASLFPQSARRGDCEAISERDGAGSCCRELVAHQVLLAVLAPHVPLPVEVVDGGGHGGGHLRPAVAIRRGDACVRSPCVCVCQLRRTGRPPKRIGGWFEGKGVSSSRVSPASPTLS